MASTKSRPDPNDYQFCKLSNAALVKFPGTINGLDFVLEDLTDCKVFLLDHSSQVQIDGCKRCEIVIGPIDGSAFFRDCSDCKVAVACRQLRTRDCHGVDLSLHVATDPVIESSSGVRICPWTPAYPEAEAQFKAANLHPTQNKWESVYDFTPPNPGDSPHWSLLGETERPDWSVPITETLSEKAGTRPVRKNESPLEPVISAPFAAEVSPGDLDLSKPEAIGDSHISTVGPGEVFPNTAHNTVAGEQALGAEEPGHEQLEVEESEKQTAVGEEAESSPPVGSSAEISKVVRKDNHADGITGPNSQPPTLQASSNADGAGLAVDASISEKPSKGAEGKPEEGVESLPENAAKSSSRKKPGVITSVLQAVRRFFSRFALRWGDPAGPRSKS